MGQPQIPTVQRWGQSTTSPLTLDVAGFPPGMTAEDVLSSLATRMQMLEDERDLLKARVELLETKLAKLESDVNF